MWVGTVYVYTWETVYEYTWQSHQKSKQDAITEILDWAVEAYPFAESHKLIDLKEKYHWLPPRELCHRSYVDKWLNINSSS